MALPLRSLSLLFAPISGQELHYEVFLAYDANKFDSFMNVVRILIGNCLNLLANRFRIVRMSTFNPCALHNNFPPVVDA